MANVLGIDIGTSSTKVMLLNSNKGVIFTCAENYQVDIPHQNYAEQSPDMWWEAVINCFKKIKEKYIDDFLLVEAISFSGQMHGLVVVDDDGRVIHPSILWMDQRSENEVKKIREICGEDTIRELLNNNVFTGFALSSLMWLKENDNKLYSKISKIMSPKDYVRFKLTGEIACEQTDASAMGAFNIENADWAWEVIGKLGIKKSIFPACHQSIDVAGELINQECLALGLSGDIKVIYGSGDQQAHSIGNGVSDSGKIICNIGTGGQIATIINKHLYDYKLRTHTFAHVEKDTYTIYGATLSSGLSLNWLINKVLDIDSFSTASRLAESVGVGSDGLIYLPYLTGERTPHMNPNAKGIMFGLTLMHEKKHFVRAVMEGVTFSLKDSLKIFEDLSIPCDYIIASGGGAKSEVWLQIQADIFDKTIYVSDVEEQACLGACILALVGAKKIESIETGIKKFVSFKDEMYYPNKKNTVIYNEIYRKFRDIYERNREIM